jgi:hypothetical protein
MDIQGLDVEAWDRWKAYRKAIRKEIKPASEHAMALKMAKYGKDQAEVVNQSIANQWQGLFELKKKLEPGEKPEKSDKQKAADEARFQYQMEGNLKMWDEMLEDGIGQLRLADAYLARLSLNRGSLDFADRLQFLKHHVADLIKRTDAKQVAADPHVKSMVRELFGEPGYRRIVERAA